MFMFIVMNFVLSMSATVFGGIMDQVAEQLSISVADTGLLNSVYAYGAGIGVPVFLIFFNRFDRTSLLKVMLGLNILATVAMLLAGNFPLLLITRFIMGFTGNCYGVLATASVAALSDEKSLGSTLSRLIMGSSLALVIGIPLTRALSGILDWRGIFWILSAMMIIALIYFAIKLPKNPNRMPQSGIISEFRFFKNKEVLLSLFTSLVTFIGYGGFYMYLTPYVLDRVPAIERYMSVFLVLVGISAFIGNLLGGKICDKLGYRKALGLGSLLQVGVACAILFTGNMGWVNAALTLWLVMNGWMNGLLINTAINVATQRKSSFMISLNGSGIQIGQALGGNIAAAIISSVGLRYTIIMCILTSIVVYFAETFAKIEQKQEA